MASYIYASYIRNIAVHCGGWFIRGLTGCHFKYTPVDMPEKGLQPRSSHIIMVSILQGCSQTLIWVGSFRRKVDFLYESYYGVRIQHETKGSGGIPPQEMF